MESFYHVIAILTAGISLTMGFFSLLAYLNNGKEKLNLVFTLLCLMVVVFILIPPVGFILTEDGSSHLSINVKRIFNLSFLAFFPWFIALYTGYKKKIMPSIVTAAIAVCYIVMIMTSKSSTSKLWVLMAITILGISLLYSFYAGYLQLRKGEIRKAIWLFAAIGIFAFFNFIGAINHFTSNPLTAGWDVLFFPINLCPLAFISIMGIQIQANSKKDSHLEKKLKIREARWQSLLQDIQLIIVHTDLDERITYINPYGTSLLKFNDPSELINTSWTDHCMSGWKKGGSKTSVENATTNGEAITISKSAILTKDGKEKIISWTTELLYNDDGEVIGRMCIGSDITQQEAATNQIHDLKSQLEKENLVTKMELGTVGMHPDTIGKSGPFMYAIQKSKQVAPTNASVLLLGETGVGKEAFADLIQRTSMRSSKPFIKVNCGALPAELIEDELFDPSARVIPSANNFIGPIIIPLNFPTVIL